MPAKRLSMRKIKEVQDSESCRFLLTASQMGPGTEQQEDCRRLWHCSSHRQ